VGGGGAGWGGWLGGVFSSASCILLVVRVPGVPCWCGGGRGVAVSASVWLLCCCHLSLGGGVVVGVSCIGGWGVPRFWCFWGGVFRGWTVGLFVSRSFWGGWGVGGGGRSGRRSAGVWGVSLPLLLPASLLPPRLKTVKSSGEEGKGKCMSKAVHFSSKYLPMKTHRQNRERTASGNRENKLWRLVGTWLQGKNRRMCQVGLARPYS